MSNTYCSLLHFERDDIQSIKITNPIQLGKSMDSKDFILDINVSLNNKSFVNLEMQVNDLGNWQPIQISSRKLTAGLICSKFAHGRN